MKSVVLITLTMVVLVSSALQSVTAYYFFYHRLWRQTEQSELLENLSYLSQIYEIETWQISGISGNEITIEWRTLPYAHLAIVHGVALIGNRTLKQPVNVTSVNWSTASSSGLRRYCKIIAVNLEVSEPDCYEDSHKQVDSRL